MLNDINEEDKEFIQYLLEQLPVGFLYMTYQDYMILKKQDKITESDINRLDLKLKLGAFKNIL